ncbi:hypothetical protein [uncultured Roseovarius sp.]|uniref:hypothetical protein n=1 Tax=uncultured Roseovarius sp. TaxID=293344 RepID=UPI002614EFC5|nr:hypothetical protein [uncultured Roseovarius sp.]
MSQLDELQARITAALDRIAKGLERPPEEPQVEVSQTGLAQQLEDERLANAQLQERVKALHAKLDTQDAAMRAAREAQNEALRKLDSDLQSLRKANQQLRDNNQALREANAGGVAEPHLINKSMLAELEGLRAARNADRDEVDTVISALGQAIAEAGGDAGADERNTDKTETSDA